jgi:hypothetical protein
MHNLLITQKIDLPGGQNRMQEMILYIAQRCAATPRFGLIKLNKILWKSDFDAYAARGVPVTGRAYQRLKFGPAPKEMAPLHREMCQTGRIKVERVDFGENIVERRTIGLVEPDLTLFSIDDLRFVDAAIDYYWDLTGTETSDDSHGVAWSTREDHAPMPYESALLSDKKPGAKQLRRIEQMIYDRGLVSD